jgi:DNA-binding LacI/PurR family transcriptional regulator
MRISGTQIGKTAASMRMQRIEQADVMPATVDVGFELIERAST